MGFYYTLSLREDSTSSTPLSLLIHACHDCTQGGRNCYTERQWLGISEPVIAWVMGVVPVSFRATEPRVLVVIIVTLHDFIFFPQLHQSTALHHLSLSRRPMLPACNWSHYYHHIATVHLGDHCLQQAFCLASSMEFRLMFSPFPSTSWVPCWSP